MDAKTQSLEDAPPAAADGRAGDTIGRFVWFLIKLLALVLAFRTLFFSPFSIPSESMLPGLMKGDYLLAAKWPYGYSRHSLPFATALPEGRLLATTPRRGDIVIFKHPLDGQEYVKRVIGLPGDRVAMLGGQVLLNGTPVPRVQIADALIPITPGSGCGWGGTIAGRGEGGEACAYPRWRETLPGGRTYDVLDFGIGPADTFAEELVPPGRLMVMGDNRDSSLDSRFPAEPGQGVGLVPEDLLVGRATLIIWSTDGSADWLNPISWFTAARWDRIGGAL